MFDIGFWELMIIGAIALLVLGPERLPGAIRSTVDTVRSIKAMANGFKQEVSNQLKTHELHEHLKQAEKAGIDNVGDDIRKSVEELKAAAASVQLPYENSKKTDSNHNNSSSSESSTKE